MQPRRKRALAALAAGGAVLGLLAVLTVTAEDRPLWGLNPDLQLWIGGILAALVGSLAYAGLGATRAEHLLLGAGWGLGGFLVLLVAAMAALALSNPGAAYYGGWQVSSRFDEAWNDTRASEALQAQGFNVTRSDSTGLYATLTDSDGDVRVRVDAAPPIRGGGNATFSLEVEYTHDGDAVDSIEEARAEARQARPSLEERFAAFLEAFEADTGWTHLGDPAWEPLLAQT